MCFGFFVLMLGCSKRIEFRTQYGVLLYGVLLHLFWVGVNSSVFRAMDCKGTQNLRPAKHFAKKSRRHRNNGSSGTQYIALAQQEANTRKSFARGDSKKQPNL